MRLLVESVPIAGGLIGAGSEVTWPRPTRPGDTLRVTTEIVEIKPSRSRPDRGLATVRLETLNQHGEAVQVSRRQACGAAQLRKRLMPRKKNAPTDPHRAALERRLPQSWQC